MEHIVVTNFKNRVNSVQDTTMLQVISLLGFATTLGYTNVQTSARGVHGCNGFQLAISDETKQMPKFVSFDAMKYWHNQSGTDTTFFGKESLMNQEIHCSSGAKLVERVKLQRTKDGVKVQNHYVKLVEGV